MNRALAVVAAAATAAAAGCGHKDLRPSVDRINESSSQMAYFHLHQALALLEARGTGRCSGAQPALEMHAGESARLLATGRSVELRSIMRRVVDLVEPKMIAQTSRAKRLRVELHTVGERAGLRADKRWRDQALVSCRQDETQTAGPDKGVPPPGRLEIPSSSRTAMP